MYKITFDINTLPKLVNARSKTSFWNYHREAKNWVNWVALALIGKLPDKPLNRANVTLTRYSSVEPDCDGLYSGMKAPLDALVKVGMVKDDRPSVINFQARWEKTSPNEGKIRFEIQELAAD